MSSIGVTAGSTEYRENWPPYSVFRKVELIPSQDSNAREARCKAKDLKTGERDTEPAEADESGADRGGGIQKRGESGLEMERSPAEQRKGHGGVEKS